MNDMYEQFRDATGGIGKIPEEILQTFSPQWIEEHRRMGVKPGQLWVAIDTEDPLMAFLVLVIGFGADKRTAVIIPVDDDPDLLSNDALIVDKGLPMNTTAIAWPGLRTEIPVRMIDNPMGDCDPNIVRMLADGRPDGIRVRVAPDVTPRDMDSYLDMTTMLHHWNNMCAEIRKSNGGQHASDSTITPARGQFARQMMETLHMNRNSVADVINGTKQLTEEQIRLLKEHGVGPSAIPGRTYTLPTDLLIEVEQPAYREYSDQLAELGNRDPRGTLAKKAFGLAARRGNTSWSGALHQAAALLIEG